MNKLIPPKHLIFVGEGDFEKVGEKFLEYFIELCDLKSSDVVLDIGCGIGRVAVPLTKYLTTGAYEGFDIVSNGIKWCQEHYTEYSNFNFQLVDIYNQAYNPNGKFKASEFKFPYQDEYFDFVFLTSVFTHMLSQDIENYVCNIARVLKKNKKCFFTAFLLNNESLQLIDTVIRLHFKYDFGIYRTTNDKIPESAVAYNEDFIKQLFEKYGFNIINTKYGSWCGRKDGLSFQDVIVVEKS